MPKSWTQLPIADLALTFEMALQREMTGLFRFMMTDLYQQRIAVIFKIVGPRGVIAFQEILMKIPDSAVILLN